VLVGEEKGAKKLLLLLMFRSTAKNTLLSFLPLAPTASHQNKIYCCLTVDCG
jgi:hypothetical protein